MCKLFHSSTDKGGGLGVNVRAADFSIPKSNVEASFSKAVTEPSGLWGCESCAKLPTTV